MLIKLTKLLLVKKIIPDNNIVEPKIGLQYNSSRDCSRKNKYIKYKSLIWKKIFITEISELTFVGILCLVGQYQISVYNISL